MTKATDLKTIFLKPLKNECRNMCNTLIFVSNKPNIFSIFYIFFIFSTLPINLTIKFSNLFFFSMSWIWKIGLWTLNMHFNPLPLPILQGLFEGGGRGAPPPCRFRPPTVNADKQIVLLEVIKSLSKIGLFTLPNSCYFDF